MDAMEKVAYLKGLMDGMNLDKDSNEYKLFAAVADVLTELAENAADLETGLCELNDQVDEIDDDLGCVEEIIYGDEEDDCDCDCDCCDDDDCDCCCYSVKCPSCDEVIELDDCDLEDGVIFCPSCNEKLEFDFDDVEEDCDCGCCCDHE